MMGVQPADFTALAYQHNLTGFGANCGIGPAELLDAVVQFADVSESLAKSQADVSCIIAKGNCGIPAYVDGEIHYHGSPDLMGSYAVFARNAGATIIGGCCGTTPEHVKAMHTKLSSSEKDVLNKDDLEAVLGRAWQNIPQAPQGNDSARRSKRRRRH